MAIEVELTIKAKAELVANVRAWARCRRVEAVIYFAETRDIEAKLLDAIEECRGEERIVVNPLREILDPQPGSTPPIDEPDPPHPATPRRTPPHTAAPTNLSSKEALHLRWGAFRLF